MIVLDFEWRNVHELITLATSSIFNRWWNNVFALILLKSHDFLNMLQLRLLKLKFLLGDLLLRLRFICNIDLLIEIFEKIEKCGSRLRILIEMTIDQVEYDAV